MDIFKSVTDWVVNNWSTFMIGTASLGTIITSVTFTLKNWVASKAQESKISNMWGESKSSIDKIAELYKKEREEKLEYKSQAEVMTAAQGVMFDAIMKIALSSKLDSDDKASIVANITRLNDLSTKEVIETVKDKVDKTVESSKELVKEVVNNPAQATVDAIKSAGTLLDKYAIKDEE